MAFGDLISLEELKVALSLSKTEVDVRRDEKLQQAITYGSQAVRSYADRAFGMPLVAETQSYEYDSSGFVDINDAWKVENVEFSFGGFKTPITTFYWRALPQAGPPFDYLSVPHWAGIYSPEMGFRQNMDVIARDRGWPGLIPLIEVTAEYGWPTPNVPTDVKQATIYTAAKFAEKPGALVSEHVANYSYTTQLRGTNNDPNVGNVYAIPAEAADLLAPYIRFQI